MSTSDSPKKPSGTRAHLERVAPNLYRHKLNDTYYGVKQIRRGVTKTHALGPENGAATTDRRLAKEYLKEWLASLDDIGDVGSAPADLDPNISFDAYLDRFLLSRAGMGDGTVKTEKSIVKKIRDTWAGKMEQMMARISGLEVKTFLTNLRGENGEEMRHSSWNRFRLFFMQLFKATIMDRLFTEKSVPFHEKTMRPKQSQDVPRFVPGESDYDRIIREIRTPSYTQPKKGTRGGQRPMSFPESADFVEFLCAAGVGEAEAARIAWEDIGPFKMRFTRNKTKAEFLVTRYADVDAILDRRRTAFIEDNPGKEPTGLIFGLKSSRKALANACARLGIRHVSPRNLRSMHMVEMVDKGISPKFIAAEQGHKDGGKLVLNLYTSVKRGDHTNWELEQVAKMEGISVEELLKRRKGVAA